MAKKRDYKRDKIGRFSGDGTSQAERERRNIKRKTLAGAAAGSVILPGIGTAAGAAGGYIRARTENSEGRTPKFKAYSAKKQARRRKKVAKLKSKAARAK